MTSIKRAAFLGAILLSFVGAGARADDQSWRMTFCQGQWWYWTEDNRWLVHDGQRWMPFQESGPVRHQVGYGGAEVSAPAVASPAPEVYAAPSSGRRGGYWGIGYWENSVGYAGYGWGGGGKW